MASPYPAKTEWPSLTGVINDDAALSIGQTFLIYNDGGTVTIKAAVTDDLAHGVVIRDLPAGESLSSENVALFGRAYPAIAGEALVWTDFGVAMLQDDAGRLDKGAGDFWYLPVKSSANPNGAAADGDRITVIKRGG